MSCGHEGHHGKRHHGHHHGGDCGCDCGCGEHSGFGPRFWTKEEKIAWLKEYLDGLKEQEKAVKERIAALKGEE